MKKVLVGLAIVVAVIGLGIISYFVVNADSENTEDKQTQFLLEATLNKTKDKYAQCYNSVNSGQILVGNVKLSYLSFDTNDEEKAKLDDTEKSFLARIANECSNTIKEYESKYQEYKKLSERTGETSSWLALLIGGSDNQPTSTHVTELEPSMVRFFSGQFSNYIFTEDDVKSYFDENLVR